ncbi:MAG: YkvA family protein [Woeseiaceae bacterium]|nr:YkvA family protein [Woeseiaceae bacterium]
MPLDITFTLSDQDLEHFQAIVDKAKEAMDNDATAEQIAEAASKQIDEARTAELPEFISDRLTKLEVVINMLGDDEWNLGEEDRKRVAGALVYFCHAEDLIPDTIPGLGFLDDAIYVELILGELKNEISAYEDFCNFRVAEENKRRARGDDPYVNREEWLADKRAALHARMRRRRKGSARSGGWRLMSW